MYEDIEYDRHCVGEFNIEGKLFNGELVFNRKSGGILLSVTKELPEEYPFSDRYGIMNVITGRLYSGTVVTLFNNRCIKNHTQNFRTVTLEFISDYMIWSNKEKVDASYNKMISILENAYRWSGFSAFKPIKESEGLEIVHPLPQMTYNWYGVKITFSPYLNNSILIPPREEETKIIQRLSVTIESQRKMPVEEFVKIRNSITSLISFAIRDNVNIYDEYLMDYDNFYQTHLEHRDYTEYYKHYLITSVPKLDIFNTLVSDYNFRMPQLPDHKDLNTTLEKLKPIFNLYLSLFKYPGMPHEMVFLNIVQALETFHSRFFYNDKKKEYVNSVIERFGSLPNFETYEKLLLCQTQMDPNCNYILLVSRLNDLFIGKNDGLFSEYYIKENYAQKIVDTRHYYTHYGEKKEPKALKGNSLLDAIYILRLLLEYHIGLILGIDNTAKIKHHLRMQSLYQKS